MRVVLRTTQPPVFVWYVPEEQLFLKWRTEPRTALRVDKASCSSREALYRCIRESWIYSPHLARYHHRAEWSLVGTDWRLP